MLLIIKLVCITYLFVYAEPMVLLRRWLGYKEEHYLEYSKVKQFVYRLITCTLCSGFWIGVFITMNLGIAAMVAVASEITTRLIQRI